MTRNQRLFLCLMNTFVAIYPYEWCVNNWLSLGMSLLRHVPSWIVECNVIFLGPSLEDSFLSDEAVASLFGVLISLVVTTLTWFPRVLPVVVFNVLVAIFAGQ